mgnify:CR=1 FL=1
MLSGTCTGASAPSWEESASSLADQVLLDAPSVAALLRSGLRCSAIKSPAPSVTASEMPPRGVSALALAMLLLKRTLLSERSPLSSEDRPPIVVELRRPICVDGDGGERGDSCSSG